MQTGTYLFLNKTAYIKKKKKTLSPKDMSILYNMQHLHTWVMSSSISWINKFWSKGGGGRVSER